MKFSYKEHTDKGAVRQANEDSLGVELDTINGSVFVVCDGMGGHVGGAMASSIAVKSIMDYFKLEFHENPFVALDDAFQFANTQIFAKTLEDPSLKGMGTTGVILLIRDEDIFIGHVGDSRIYIKSRGQLSRLTKDHSYVQQLVDQGIIQDEEAESHPQKNQILKALGHSEEVKPTICQQPIKAKKGDLFLLCSDGQCGMVVDRDMEELIDGDNIEASVENLYNVAMEHGGTDNITNILIKITESTNPTSSFKDVGPKRNKPRNPDFETTNAMQGANEVEEDYPVEKPKSKMLWIGLAASLIIGIAVYFMFFNNDGPVVGEGDKGGSDQNKLTITSEELEKKSKEEMDVFIKEVDEGKEYSCDKCEKEYTIENVKYVLSFEDDVITKVEKAGKDPEPGPVKPGPVKPGPVKPEPVKPEPVKPEPVKPQTGTLTYKVVKGDTYTTLENLYKKNCKGTITKDDWNPVVTNVVIEGKIYTCDCPK
jgi:serine/threonine protein phosphatase PrpC